MKRCRHCRRGKVARPRGLCWNCYYEPGVRELYPAAIKYQWRGPGVGRRHSLPPPFPTSAAPGSPEKILVLTQRLEQGFDLWHPDDATMDGGAELSEAG
jgi:hypothetical protein